MQSILIVTTSKFPEGDAGSVRLDQISQSFQSLGYAVYCLCGGTGEREGVFRGTHYRRMLSPYRTRFGKAVSYLRGTRFTAFFEDFVRAHGKPAAMYLFLGNALILWQARVFSDQQRIPRIHDCVEWYSPGEFAYGRFSRPYIHNDLINRYVIRRPCAVVAISRYFAAYFSEKGIPTVRIPATTDVRDGAPVPAQRSGPVRLVYAGTPGRKDDLVSMLQGLALLTEAARARVELHVVGVTKQQLAALPGSGEELVGSLGRMLTAYGRQSRERTLAILRECDFSVLLRPAEERFAKAGFPSKSAEAMGNGLAMLCNLSSDLGDYLADGENALLCASRQPADVAETLRRAAALSDDAILAIRRRARETAEQRLDYRIYTETVHEALLAATREREDYR